MPKIAETARKLRENVQKVIVGKDEAINLAPVAVLCEGNVLLEDVPGIGKTTLARPVAVSLGCTFRRIQFTLDLLPTDVTGLIRFNQNKQEFEYHPGPIVSPDLHQLAACPPASQRPGGSARLAITR